MTDKGRVDACREILIDHAKRGQTITYGELAHKLGMAAQGPWKDMLDEIFRGELAVGHPDVTLVAIKKSTGFSSIHKIGKLLDPNDPSEVNDYLMARKEVFDFWAE